MHKAEASDEENRMNPEGNSKPAETAGERTVTLCDALKVWIRVALLSFGGPTGQIAVMHRILVEEKRWISESRFLHALNFCMLLPGPEAQQLATYIGWLLHRTKGGLLAGGLFVLPGFVCILALSLLYTEYGHVPIVVGLFYGLKPAIVAIVIDAVLRMARRTLKNHVMVLTTVTAFVAIFIFEMPFPVVIFSAAVVGFLGGRLRPDLFAVMRGHTAKEENEPVPEAIFAIARPSLKRSLAVAGVWLSLWIGPVAALWIWAGENNIYTQQALFFSKTAVVTFGGAYSVLAYMAQECVHTHHWLTASQMVDGLGMAETTPGPLIQVVQFVGYLGAYDQHGPLSPILAGIAGSLLATWVTFVPSFLWIFLGAPYVERLRDHAALRAALSVIGAAVVGVVLNLSIWFGLHVIFARVNEQRWGVIRLLVPDLSSIDLVALAINVFACLAMFQFKIGMGRTLFVSAILGICYQLVREVM
jgi:chromate transporter